MGIKACAGDLRLAFRRHGACQAEETILLVQGTTILNYNTDKKTHGIGYISDKTLGVNIHTCLAVIAGGLVLRVLNQQPRPEG